LISCAALLIPLLTLPAAAHAQGRYRVAISTPGSSRVIVAEFRPCVPAEGSDCGGWIDKEADSASAIAPVVTNAVSPDARDSVSIRNGVVVLTRLTSPRRQDTRRLRSAFGAPVAVAISSDSRYAFVAYRAPSGDRALISMIDLSTRRSVFSLPLSHGVAGIAALP
jgi:hypothetical protein